MDLFTSYFHWHTCLKGYWLPGDFLCYWQVQERKEVIVHSWERTL